MLLRQGFAVVVVLYRHLLASHGVWVTGNVDAGMGTACMQMQQQHSCVVLSHIASQLSGGGQAAWCPGFHHGQDMQQLGIPLECVALAFSVGAAPCFQKFVHLRGVTHTFQLKVTTSHMLRSCGTLHLAANRSSIAGSGTNHCKDCMA